jgi:ethanolamine ammonia-lyase small subunit
MNRMVRAPHPSLREMTPARVALERAGDSLATSEVLRFQLAHAQARDAVHDALAVSAFAERMRAELPMLRDAGIPVLELRTNAPDRADYLRQPHLGRTLAPESSAQLRVGAAELAIVLADGLSARAVESNAIPLLGYLLPQLIAEGWTLAPVSVVAQGRVAIGDPIGFLLGAKCSLVLIGERPGLSTPSSLGAYLTWAPHPDRTDADRNCLSNIHAAGLSAEEAAARLRWYLEAARAGQRTGVALKEGAAETMEGTARQRLLL